MNNGQLIPYVEKCIHLGNILSSTSREQAMITSSITDLKLKQIISSQSFLLMSQPHYLDYLAHIV